jgi:signal transduction histidine kinase
VVQAKEAAAYDERQRLARDLHDSVSQTLFSAATIAETLPRIWERDPEKSLQHLQQIVTLNRGALAEMRVLLWELRPEAILRAELSEMAQYLIEAAKGRARINAEMIENGPPMPLTDDAKLMIYRILQESINNILKHSRAKNFTVEIHYQPDHIRIQIKDEGQGFDIQRTTAGIGLSSMRERAEKIGAIFSIQSEIGKGTTVTLRWQPLGAPTTTTLGQGAGDG